VTGLLGRGIVKRGVLALAGIALVAACASPLVEGEEEPPQLYRLTAPDLSGRGLPQTGMRMVIGEPGAAVGLDTDQIAVVEDAERLQYYADAQWAETAPEMVQGVLVEAFRTSGGLAAVGRRSVAIDPQARLRTEIVHLEAVYPAGGGGPVARVALQATLISQPGRSVIASRRFEAQAEPASPSVPAVVDALDRAADEAVSDLATWALDRLAAGA
jgi:cholesterol transport system auxiliary component